MSESTSQEKDMELAMKLAIFLNSLGFGMAFVVDRLDTGVISIKYSDDFPPVRIEKNTVIWPQGSPYDLVMGMLGG